MSVLNWLIDTNLLVYSIPAAGGTPHPLFTSTTETIRHLLTLGESIWMAPQNLIEFYATLTRPVSLDSAGNPRRNSGLGYTYADAIVELIDKTVKLRTMLRPVGRLAEGHGAGYVLCPVQRVYDV